MSRVHGLVNCCGGHRMKVAGTSSIVSSAVDLTCLTRSGVYVDLRGNCPSSVIDKLR